MRLPDMLKISIKNIKSKWAVPITFCMAVSSFCLCFAFTVLLTVRQEKATPFELIVSAENDAGVTDAILAEILDMKDVKNATPVIHIPVHININGYGAELVLTGIKPSYLDGKNRLPEDGVMPYIILNESACKLFAKEDADTDLKKETPDDSKNEVPKIDWLNTKTTLTLGEEGTTVTGRICDVLESEKDEEAVAYISLNTAKGLLKTNIQPAVCQQAYVRIKNMGRAEGVSRRLESLELTVANADEQLQAKWETWTKEMTYLFVLGAFCLLFTKVLLFLWRRMDVVEQKDAHEALYFMGVTKSTMAYLFTLQNIIASLMGACIGIFIAMALPSFLPKDLNGVSIFMLPVPIIISFTSIVLFLGNNIFIGCVKKYDAID